MKKAAKKINAKNVLLKGGHLPGDLCIDILYSKNSFVEFKNTKIKDKNVHGTGCFLSSNITALISKGLELEKVVENAVKITNDAIKNSYLGLLNFSS